MQPVAMNMSRGATGSHLKVAREVGDDSPTHKMVRRMEIDTLESNLTPESVSQAILDVIEAPDRPLRKPMDRARVLGVVKRFAPQALIDRMIGGLLAGT